MDIVKHNKSAWDNYVDKKVRWTIPVSEQELQNAKSGNWDINLTLKKSVPNNWLENIAIQNVKCAFCIEDAAIGELVAI